MDPTIEELLQARFTKLVFAPLGRESAHAIAVQGYIQVDPRSRTPLGRNLLHELLHVIRPLWSENRVLQWESKLWNAATWKEKAQFFQLLGRGEIIGEEQLENADERVEH